MVEALEAADAVGSAAGAKATVGGGDGGGGLEGGGGDGGGGDGDGGGVDVVGGRGLGVAV